MQIKLIFIRKVLNVKPLWKWELLELGDGLLAKDCAQAQYKQAAFARPKYTCNAG